MRRSLLLFLLSCGALFAQSDASGRMGGTGMQLFPSNAQTSTYQTLQSDFQFCKTIPVSSGTFTITLVASTSQPGNGRCILILNYGSGVVTVAPSGQNINGSSSSLTIPAGTAAQPRSLWVVSDGTNYEAQPEGGATLGANNFTGLQNITLAPGANTITDGLQLYNTTAATSGNQQYSPAIHLEGQGWKTTATAASQPVDWQCLVEPVQGTANPSSNLMCQYAVNNGSYTTGFTATSAGNLDAQGAGTLSAGVAAVAGLGFNGGTVGFVYGGGGMNFMFGGSATTGVLFGYLGSGGGAATGLISATSDGVIGFSQYAHNNGTNFPYQGVDTTIDRDAAGVIGITNGTQGTTAANYRDLALRAVIAKGPAPSISGCSAGSQTGGQTAGTYASGTTGSCAVTLTFNTTAPNGWTCSGSDITTTADTQTQTGYTTTSCTLTGTTVSADVIVWQSKAF